MEEQKQELAQNDAIEANPVDASNAPQPSALDSDPSRITWTASEFIDHAKSVDWYLALGVVAVLTSVLLYVLFRDLITSSAIIVIALALALYARRQPRQLEYSVDSYGLTIAEKHFPYATFRSFTIIDEGPFSSIVFLPLKRFGLAITVYFSPEDEDKIATTINQHLPFEQRSPDPIDRFMKRIRF